MSFRLPCSSPFRVEDGGQTNVCLPSPAPAMLRRGRSLSRGVARQQLPQSPITEILRACWNLTLASPELGPEEQYYQVLGYGRDVNRWALEIGISCITVTHL